MAAGDSSQRERALLRRVVLAIAVLLIVLTAAGVVAFLIVDEITRRGLGDPTAEGGAIRWLYAREPTIYTPKHAGILRSETMIQGSVIGINITPESGAPIQSVDAIHAVAGKGLQGDRYFGAEDSAPVSLIAAEAIDAMEREVGYKLAYGDARRNIITRDVPLADLVDCEFQVGDVVMRGLRLSEPCQHLASLTDPRVLQGLIHRAGLKAEILNDGVIRVGDSVRTAKPSLSAKAPHGG